MAGYTFILVLDKVLFDAHSHDDHDEHAKQIAHANVADEKLRRSSLHVKDLLVQSWAKPDD